MNDWFSCSFGDLGYTAFGWELRVTAGAFAARLRCASGESQREKKRDNRTYKNKVVPFTIY